MKGRSSYIRDNLVQSNWQRAQISFLSLRQDAVGLSDQTTLQSEEFILHSVWIKAKKQAICAQFPPHSFKWTDLLAQSAWLY